MNHLPASILNLLGFTSGGGRKYGRGRNDEEEDDKGDMTDMVKKLVMDQHRTMFYTVTLSPVSQRKQSDHTSKVVAPSLKWQCASSLSKSRILLARTNSNSNKYYNITFIDADLDNISDSSGKDELLSKSKSFSPVKIYIET